MILLEKYASILHGVTWCFMKGIKSIKLMQLAFNLDHHPSGCEGENYEKCSELKWQLGEI